MIPCPKKIVLILLFLLVSLPAHDAQADTGPKPTMEFEFQQDLPGEPLTIIWGTLYECELPDCSDAAPLEELGPQGFSCTVDHCDAQAYGFAPYHRLEIEFSDGELRESNVFETAGFNSIYRVTILPEDLLVDEQFDPGFPVVGTTVLLLCACALCSGVLVIALVLFIVLRTSRK